MTSARFMQRLRLLTRIYDVPLLFDEVQTGWGMTGRLWAHELFDLPCPPDVVIWAKKAQNGVLFVSEELATFFQEEKKFNTTWEGDSVGMVRLLAHARPARSRAGARAPASARAPGSRRWRATTREPDQQRARRRRDAGVRRRARRLARRAARPRVPPRPRCCCRPASARCASIRATTPSPTRSTRRSRSCAARSRTCCGAHRSSRRRARARDPRRRRSTCPLEAIERARPDGRELRGASRRRSWRSRSSATATPSQYPPDVLRAGRRPLLQFPPEMLRGDALQSERDRRGAARPRLGRIVAYALGSALEDHDEEGVSSDPRLGENNTFYLQAMATLPSVKNQVEIENHLLDIDPRAGAGRGLRRTSRR